MSSPCAYYSHSTALRQLPPLLEGQVRPLSHIRSIYGHTSRYREQRTTVLSAQNALPHHVPDPPLRDPLEHTWQLINLCTRYTHSIHPTHYVVRPFCALVPRMSPWAPCWVQTIHHPPIQALDGTKLDRKWRSSLRSADPALADLFSIERIRNTVSNRRTCRDR